MLIKPRLLTLLLFIITVTLTACSAFGPKQHLIPKEKAETALQRKFPVTYNDSTGLLSLKIHSPLLSLDPQQNRVNISGSYAANATLVEIQGSFVFSSKLHYDAETRGIFMSDARFDSFKPSGGFFEEKLRSLLNEQVSEFVSMNPLYIVKPDELVVLGVKLDVMSIDIVNEGILLKFKATQ